MNIDGTGESEFPDEDKGVEDRVLGDMESSHGAGLNVGEDEAADGLQGSGVVQVQNQQSQGTVFCWERFLHVRSIRVLLVEKDDSTRHVVSALLRNCNYEVVDAANGLQAWKILEDLTNHIDLVLTEVVMPCLSGIALLCKIMSHKSRKNIPVIMMSSNDSMGLVVMCLSKGAVDFLVKPIRKNELKNLWQHVWRRCQSSSGSGSESGTQNQKYKSKESQKLDNNDSEDGENDESNGLTVGDGSDDGSGAQSSWTKRAIDIDSSQAMTPIDQAAECQDSTCAQVIHSNAKTSGTKQAHRCLSGEDLEIKLSGTNVKSKDLVTSISRKRESLSENPFEISLVPVCPNSKSLSESNCNMNCKQVEYGLPNPTNDFSIEKLKYGLDKMPRSSIDAQECESSREMTNILNTSIKAANDLKGPNLEISLKRLRGVHDIGRSVQDDRYILRRSEQSAFSRYNTSLNLVKIADGITGSSSVVDCSGEAAKRESVGDIQALSTDLAVNQGSNGVSNNIDMGSTTDKLSTHPSTRKDKSEATSTINCVKPSVKHEKNDLRSTQQQDSLLLQQDKHATDLALTRCLHKDKQVRHPEFQINHNQHPHFCHLEEQPYSYYDSTQKLDPPFGSSNGFIGRMDDDHNNYSLNRSGSGSNHGSNGQKGINGENDFGQAGKSGSGDASGCGNRVDENKLTQREAALNKFRQKRKERCFKKKVRYQNRKKLAEQRPRVRGQFVKQGGNGSSRGPEE